MVPRVGQKIGPYEILGPLGTGGMGLVFSAWDARLHRDVAIKLLRDEFSTEEMRARFLQEARAASALNHPNICTIFDLGEFQGDPFLVMELLKGRTLRARILEGPLPFEDLLQVTLEIAEALTAAHARGVIHRDIKPANIILVEKPDGRFVTKVLDFGLAKVELPEGLNAALDYTNAGSTVGTVAYMSPEQARGEALDARSDLFALGAVAYEMATGETPFRGATSAMVFVQLLNHPPESVRQLNPDIPREFERVLRKLLQKDRSQRYQSAADLVKALEDVRRKVKPSRGFWKGFLSPAPASATPAGRVDLVLEGENAPPAAPVSPPSRPVAPDMVLRPVRRIVSSERPRHRPSATALAKAESSREALAGIEATVGEQGVLQFREQRPESGPAPVAHAAPVDVEHFAEATVLAPAAQDEATPVPAAESTSQPAHEPLALQASAANRAQEPALAAAENDPESEAAETLSPEEMAASASRRMATLDAELRSAFGQAVAATPVRVEAAGARGPILLATAAGLVMLLSGGLLGWRAWMRHRAAVLPAPQTMVLGRIDNNTGDDGLEPAVLGGLELDLAQSSRLAVLGQESLRAGLRAQSNAALEGTDDAEVLRAADSIGAGLMLTGSVRLSAGSYQVQMRVVDTGNGASRLEVSATAFSREQIPGTIDVLAADIRSGLGEGGESVARSSVPLARDASANLDALASYARGKTLMDSGQFLQSMEAFQAATKADPHFAAPHLALAELFRRQRADVQAAQEAELGLQASGTAAGRTRGLAQAAVDLYSTGDLPKAEQELTTLLATDPDDPELITALSTCLRVEGKFQESLDTANRLLKRNPYALDAASNAEYSLIALDRTETAAQMEDQIQRSGHSHPGLRLLLNLLRPREDGPDGVEMTGAMGRLAPQQYQAMMLDAAGMLEGGLEAWHAVAAQASANPDLASAASHTLAVAALDRALVDQCAASRLLRTEAQAYVASPTTTYHLGLAAAFCGDLDAASESARTLAASSKQNWAVNSYLLPDLQAAILWKQHAADPRKPLEASHPYDRLSFGPYLRGMMHLEEKQPQAAIVDFQGVLEHHGATTLTNPMIYAMAQFGLARAYAAGGDSANASEAYRRFLNLWATADPDLPMLREARAHTQ